jgi:lipoate-protein ligase A
MMHDMIWRFIIDPPLCPAMNMAIDEAIAYLFIKDKMPPTLRLYQWESPALTLGSFQKVDATLRHFLETNPVTPIRRITGGQALLHDKDLTYSIIASTHDPLFSGGIKKTFYSIAQGLLVGLAQLGVSAEIHTPMSNAASLRGQRALRGRSPFCATSLSWYEIAIDEKKLVGSAQKRWPDHFLQHGSLPLVSTPFEDDLYKGRSLNLYDLINRLVSPFEMEGAMKLGFETAWTIKLTRGSLTSEEIKLANHLVTEKYNNTGWTQRTGYTRA